MLTLRHIRDGLASKSPRSRSDGAPWDMAKVMIHWVLWVLALSETMFGLILWVRDDPHEAQDPGFPTGTWCRSCFVWAAVIRVTHFVCHWFYVVADRCTCWPRQPFSVIGRSFLRFSLVGFPVFAGTQVLWSFMWDCHGCNQAALLLFSLCSLFPLLSCFLPVTSAQAA